MHLGGVEFACGAGVAKTLGAARGELFSSDRLHLNAEGYSLWQRVIASRLKV